MSEKMEYDLDERTILIHDLWQAKQLIEDAQYRADVIALLLKDKERFSKIRSRLNALWEELDDLREDIRRE